jgi:GcrA cell cycle regulator
MPVSDYYRNCTATSETSWVTNERHWVKQTGPYLLWPKENVERLKELFTAGASASKIAEELGCGLTRNAVIGKIHRMGLQNNRSSIPKNGRIPVTETHYTERHRLRVTLIETPPEMAEVPNIKPSEFDKSIPPDQRKTLLQLNGHTCRWPIGEVGKPDFFFCGSYTNKTYCPHHTMRAGR